MHALIRRHRPLSHKSPHIRVSSSPISPTIQSQQCGSKHVEAMASNRGTLPAHIEKVRSRVTVNFKKPSNPSGVYAATTYASLDYDNSLSVEQFRIDCQIRFTHSVHDQTVFEIINIDAPLANAIRRVLLVEVPTIAIENVFVHSNTSIMHDEQLAHRLGLIPLLVDPHPFKIWLQDDPVTKENTVKFRLKIECKNKPGAPKDGNAPPDVLYINHQVLSGEIEYVPMEGQEGLLKGNIPRPVHDDILICKLRPGQKIHVEMDATKNIGREHAKWSPVCTASYRMLPEVTIIKQPDEDIARKLKKLCPADVFDIEDDGIVAARPMECTMCRECVREEPFSKHVELTRKRDHFIFDVESTGALPASSLVTDALDVIIRKCDTVLKGLDAALKRRGQRERRETQEPGDDIMDVEGEDLS